MEIDCNSCYIFCGLPNTCIGLTLPYPSGQAFYHPALWSPAGQMCIHVLTLKLQRSSAGFCKPEKSALCSKVTWS